jgi:hypothetical protein
MKTIKLSKSIVSILDNQIIQIHLKSNQEIELPDALEIFAAMGELSKGKKFPVFIDAGDFVSIDEEVRSFSASKVANIYTLADAIAVDSLAQKLLANFYIKNDQPAVPSKVFTNKHEALQWLKTFIKGAA